MYCMCQIACIIYCMQSPYTQCCPQAFIMELYLSIQGKV